MKLNLLVLMLVLGAFAFGAFSSSDRATATAPPLGSDPFIGEVMWVPYNFAPRGWALCDGQILAISQNTALFSLIGTTYGGDGRTTFALPDLRGRMPMHAGSGPGLSTRRLGEKGGAETVTMTIAQMPAHTHGLATGPNGTVPVGAATSILDTLSAFSNAPPSGYAAVIGNTGGGQAQANLSPYLVLHAVIALQGMFPSRN